MIIYVHNTCTTCQKALRLLEKMKISVTIKDIVQEPPSVEELQKMLSFQNNNMTKLLNTSGQLYREMQLSQKWKEMQLPEIYHLLSRHGMLIKRPFLIGDSFGLTGFKEDEWTQQLTLLLPGKKS